MNLCEKVTCITHGIKLIKLCLMLTFIVVFLEQQNQFDSRPRRIHAEAEPDSRWLHQSCNTITDDKDLVSDSSSCPEFIKDLLQSAERTVLLYHLSYLYLRDFPELERLIRKRAVETQMLSGSSEALMVKCAEISENILKLLLPSLKVAAEKNKPEFTQKFLEKAKGWISDIIMDVEEIVKRYEKHNSDVCNSTSDIITEKQQQTHEMEELQKIIDGLEEKRLNISKTIEDNEEKIKEKNADIQKIISGRGYIYSILVFIFSPLVSLEEDQLIALSADLSKITEAQERLKEEEPEIKNQLMENQQKLAKLKMKKGLDDAENNLSKIPNNLVQLQQFLEKVGSKLDKLKKEHKEEILQYIDAAEEGWTTFGNSCMKANKTFSIQTNEVYSFLEINPSSLSEEEWQKEYDSVNEKLHS